MIKLKKELDRCYHCLNYELKYILTQSHALMVVILDILKVLVLSHGGDAFINHIIQCCSQGDESIKDIMTLALKRVRECFNISCIMV